MEHLTFSFKSDYGKEDIEDTLTEIVAKNITFNWISRERIMPLGSEHLCTVVLQEVNCQNFSWPIMEGENLEVKINDNNKYPSPGYAGVSLSLAKTELNAS